MLFKSCKEENKYSYFISDINELKKEWFTEGESIGICGATSTPRWLMEKVEDSIQNML